MISLLFLTRNRRGIVARCFRSLVPTLARGDVEWRIIDNGSTDGTAEWLMKLARQYPDRVFVELHADNTGVAGGRQLLLDAARGERLVILDSDVEARDPAWLDKLLAPLDDPRVGICGPAGHWLCDNWLWYEPVTAGYTGSVDVVAGYCQAFRRDVLERGVTMDMAFNPYWHEDSDWCLQIRALGLDVICTGEVGLFHIFSGTGADASGYPKQRYLASKWQGKGLVRMEQSEAVSA